MEIKKGKTKILTKDQLSIDLSNIIENKHKNLIRLANAELLTLFWLIGNKINTHFGSIKGIELEQSAIRSISTRLAGKYGSFFSERNFKKMKLFADLFPDLSDVKQFIHFVSWRHVLLLLQIPDWNERRFLLNYKIKHGLSVKNLREKISIGIYEKQNGKLWKKKVISPIGKIAKNSMSLLQIPPLSFELVTLNDKVLDNVFKESKSYSFQKLTETSNGFFKKSKRSSMTLDRLFQEISEEIIKYRRHQNTWLNAHFNLLFWELGKCINQKFSDNLESAHRETIIRNTSLLLEKKYGKNFTEEQVKASIKFANQFQNPGIVSRIAYLLSWEHILVILPLQEIEAVLFYARLVAIKGLNVEDLRKQIAKKVYEKSPGAKKLEQDLLYSLRNPNTETTILKKGNSIEGDTTVNYEFDDVDSFVVQNIFKNSYFLDFVSTFKVGR